VFVRKFWVEIGSKVNEEISDEDKQELRDLKLRGGRGLGLSFRNEIGFGRNENDQYSASAPTDQSCR